MPSARSFRITGKEALIVRASYLVKISEEHRIGNEKELRNF